MPKLFADGKEKNPAQDIFVTNSALNEHPKVLVKKGLEMDNSDVEQEDSGGYTLIPNWVWEKAESGAIQYEDVRLWGFLHFRSSIGFYCASNAKICAELNWPERRVYRRLKSLEDAKLIKRVTAALITSSGAEVTGRQIYLSNGVGAFAIPDLSRPVYDFRKTGYSTTPPLSDPTGTPCQH